jgi:aryl-alcohol dehydrogenase-like predicted oxidoreductase
MDPREFGQTGVSVSPITLGSWPMSGDRYGAIDDSEAVQTIRRALERGITSFDTAPGYGSGHAEETLGAALVGRREQAIVTTKCGIVPQPSGQPGRNSSRASILHEIDDSLRRLRTDHVDVYYLHQPDRSVLIDETVAALGEFVQEGKVRALGVSNFSAWQIGDVFAACDSLGAPRPILAQQLYNLVARRIETEYVEFATTKGLATIVYNPLGGGLLTGRHSFTQSPAQGRFGDSALATMYKDRYWNPETFAVIEALGAIASEADLTLPELSLRWLLSKPVVSAVLLGGSKPHQLEANITAAQAGPLTDDVIAACDEAGLALAGSMPGYNR